MISILIEKHNRLPVARLFRAKHKLGCDLRILTYSEVFGSGRIPAGTLVFTDFDLLRPFEIDAANQIAFTARSHDPEVPILNQPGAVCQRVMLLNDLRAKGLNPVRVTRLDTGETPDIFPVFIRSEDGCAGPETGLIPNPEAFQRAVEGLKAQGQTLKGRIAVSFHAEKDTAGYYRKYGAFVIGDQIIPQHLMRNDGWNVKRNAGAVDAAFAREEAAFIDDNPHARQLLEIARAGHIDFGRIDYTILGGEVVVFEINTNPTFPRFLDGSSERAPLRHVILERVSLAMQAIDHPATAGPAMLDLSHVPSASFIERDQWYLHPEKTVFQTNRWSARLRRMWFGPDPKRKRSPKTPDAIE